MQLRSRKDPEIAHRIGARIRELRDAAGITQETLAWDCSVDRGYVGHIERGDTVPSVPVLAQIARRLGVEVVDIVGVVGSPERAALLVAVRRKDKEAVRQNLRLLGLE